VQRRRIGLRRWVVDQRAEVRIRADLTGVHQSGGAREQRLVVRVRANAGQRRELCKRLLERNGG
jgi:hypothetical protein